jgi:MFS family permease
LVLAYAVVIWADSSSLTAGASGSALPGQRGATLAVHTTLGYAGGFLGPLILGMTLDFVGGASPYGWGMGFAAIAVVVLIGPLAMWMLKPKGLEGDRPA